MNGRIVIAAYRPKPGKGAELEKLMNTHLSTLHSEGLVTERPSIAMKATDGTILEVFEWKSKEAIAQAHSNPTVLQMWQEYAEVCDFVPVDQVDEMAALFSEFTPLN